MRVYDWADKNAKANSNLLFNGAFAPGRVGDNIEVVGDVDGTATVFVPSTSTDNRLLKFSISGGVANTTPTAIIYTGNTVGVGADVSSIDGTAGSDLLGARFTNPSNIVRLTQTGTITDSLKKANITNKDIFDALSVKAFTVNGKKMFAAAAANFNGTTNGSKVGTLFIVDYTEGLGNVTDANIKQVLFTPDSPLQANENATGGVDVIVDGNEATIYALLSNMGIGAYKVTVE